MVDRNSNRSPWKRGANESAIRRRSGGSPKSFAAAVDCNLDKVCVPVVVVVAGRDSLGGIRVSGTQMAKEQINDYSTIVPNGGNFHLCEAPLNSLIFGTYCGQELLLRRRHCCCPFHQVAFRYLSVLYCLQKVSIQMSGIYIGRHSEMGWGIVCWWWWRLPLRVLRRQFLWLLSFGRERFGKGKSVKSLSQLLSHPSYTRPSSNFMENKLRLWSIQIWFGKLTNTQKLVDSKCANIFSAEGVVVLWGVMEKVLRVEFAYLLNLQSIAISVGRRRRRDGQGV